MNEKYKFTKEEIQALYRILSHQWINREDEEALAVVDKISRIVKFLDNKK
jgi:hypothetical protein